LITTPILLTKADQLNGFKWAGNITGYFETMRENKNNKRGIWGDFPQILNISLYCHNLNGSWYCGKDINSASSNYNLDQLRITNSEYTLSINPNSNAELEVVIKL
jgi:hypothetical protein